MKLFELDNALNTAPKKSPALKECIKLCKAVTTLLESSLEVDHPSDVVDVVRQLINDAPTADDVVAELPHLIAHYDDYEIMRDIEEIMNAYSDASEITLQVDDLVARHEAKLDDYETFESDSKEEFRKDVNQAFSKNRPMSGKSEKALKKLAKHGRRTRGVEEADYEGGIDFEPSPEYAGVKGVTTTSGQGEHSAKQAAATKHKQTQEKVNLTWKKMLLKAKKMDGPSRKEFIPHLVKLAKQASKHGIELDPNPSSVLGGNV